MLRFLPPCLKSYADKHRANLQKEVVMRINDTLLRQWSNHSYISQRLYDTQFIQRFTSLKSNELPVSTHHYTFELHQ